MRTMKTALKALALLLVIAPTMMLSSCSDVDDGSYVAPITLGEKVSGKWVVESVTQVDETNSKEMNITSLFDFGTFALNLNVDDENHPTTFTVEGNAPAILPASGTWKMENDFTSTDGTAAKILLNDKVGLTVTAVPGATKTLEFKFTRTSKGVAFVSYVYHLVPVETTDVAAE